MLPQGLGLDCGGGGGPPPPPGPGGCCNSYGEPPPPGPYACCYRLSICISSMFYFLCFGWAVDCCSCCWGPSSGPPGPPSF
ncbi:hypothetical protein Droror1_Dr00024821 [Drosera rotundifolia]